MTGSHFHYVYDLVPDGDLRLSAGQVIGDENKDSARPVAHAAAGEQRPHFKAQWKIIHAFKNAAVANDEWQSHVT